LNQRPRVKGEKKPMKKLGIFIFCVLALFVLAFVGSAGAAGNAAFTHTNYLSSTEPTIDGTYAPGAEWLESGTQYFGTNGIFRDEWTMGTPVKANLLIETTDNTNDAGDYWVVCWDSTADGGATEPNGGAHPQTDDYKLVITGHDAPTVQWYKGTGTAWATVASPAAAVFTQAQSLSVTPKIGTPHYVLEFFIDKTDTSLGTVIMGYNWDQYTAYYDAHAGGNGLQSWPPANATPPGSADVPDSWGYIPYAFNANPTPDVPENIGIAVMLAVSSVAVAGVVLLRKLQK
jgi:hypothetical protein